MTSPDPIERLGEALDNARFNADLDWLSPDTLRDLSEAALSALRPGDSFNGMVLVPEKPTLDMVEAGEDTLEKVRKDIGCAEVADEIYRAMLAAVREGK
jgi:hypothetical protein